MLCTLLRTVLLCCIARRIHLSQQCISGIHRLHTMQIQVAGLSLHIFADLSGGKSGRHRELPPGIFVTATSVSCALALLQMHVSGMSEQLEPGAACASLHNAVQSCTATRRQQDCHIQWLPAAQADALMGHRTPGVMPGSVGGTGVGADPPATSGAASAASS